MMTRFKIPTLTGWFLLFIILWCAEAGLAADRVLILHSYHAEFEWVKGINEILGGYLKTSGIDHSFFYMDTKHQPGADSKKRAADQARHVIGQGAFKVVVAVDDNAQDLVVRHYAGKSALQFVFAGVNADPEAYGFPANNVTGILERTYADQVLNMLKKIIPSAKNIIWLSDDSTTAKIVLKRVRRRAESGQLPLAVKAYIQPATFDEWKAAVLTWDSDPSVSALLVPLYHTVRTHTGGQSLPAADVMRWTVTHTRKPVVGLWPFSMNDGALCAVVVDPKEHGKVAALLVKQILSGKKAGDLPMVTNQDGYVMINMAVADRLGLDVPFEVILGVDEIIE